MIKITQAAYDGHILNIRFDDGTYGPIPYINMLLAGMAPLDAFTEEGFDFTGHRIGWAGTTHTLGASRLYAMLHGFPKPSSDMDHELQVHIVATRQIARDLAYIRARLDGFSGLE